MSGWCPFVERVAGVKTYTPGGLTRVGFCCHIAAGYMSTMRNPAFWNGAGVSAHFCVGRDGSAVQLVSIFDTAYAQGRLGPISWPPYAEQQTANPNDWLISTEHEGFPGEEWTPEMYATDLAIKRWCLEQIPGLLQYGLDSLTGHYMFDGINRASCPGPTWPRERLYADLTGGEEAVMGRIVQRPGTSQTYTVVLDAKGDVVLRFNHSATERQARAFAAGKEAAPEQVTPEEWAALEAVAKVIA